MTSKKGIILNEDFEQSFSGRKTRSQEKKGQKSQIHKEEIMDSSMILNNNNNLTTISQKKQKTATQKKTKKKQKDQSSSDDDFYNDDDEFLSVISQDEDDDDEDFTQIPKKSTKNKKKNSITKSTRTASKNQSKHSFSSSNMNEKKNILLPHTRSELNSNNHSYNNNNHNNNKFNPINNNNNNKINNQNPRIPKPILSENSLINKNFGKILSETQKNNNNNNNHEKNSNQKTAVPIGFDLACKFAQESYVSTYSDDLPPFQKPNSDELFDRQNENELSREEVEFISDQIKKGLNLYMEIDEISIGLINMMVPKEFIDLFWTKIIELNQNFFQFYNFRIKANQQIAKFNSLVTTSLISKKRKVENTQPSLSDTFTKPFVKTQFDTSFFLKRLKDAHQQKISQESTLNSNNLNSPLISNSLKPGPPLSRKSSENFNTDEFLFTPQSSRRKPP